MNVTFLLPTGYFVDFGAAPPAAGPLYANPAADAEISARYDHAFCGENTTPGADCPNCRKPLLQILRLDLSDPRLGAIKTPAGRLPLLYCWRCNIVTGVLSYRLEPNGAVTLLDYAAGIDEGLLPEAPDYPDSFPGVSARLLCLSDDAQSYIRELNRDEAFDDSGYPDELSILDRCVHQVGGVPYLVNGDSYGPLLCPACARPMPLVASLGTQCLDPRGLLIVEVNNYVQMLYHYCNDCAIVSVVNESD